VNFRQPAGWRTTVIRNSATAREPVRRLLIWALVTAGVGSLLSGVNFTVTILKMRRAGMTPDENANVCLERPKHDAGHLRIPDPHRNPAMLALDRTGYAFLYQRGRWQLMMYINLIWAWDTLKWSILILPVRYSLRCYSEVVATFSRKRPFVTRMVWTIMAIVFLCRLPSGCTHFFTGCRWCRRRRQHLFFGIMTMIAKIGFGASKSSTAFTACRAPGVVYDPMLRSQPTHAVHWGVAGAAYRRATA